MPEGRRDGWYLSNRSSFVLSLRVSLSSIVSIQHAATATTPAIKATTIETTIPTILTKSAPAETTECCMLQKYAAQISPSRSRVSSNAIIGGGDLAARGMSQGVVFHRQGALGLILYAVFSLCVYFIEFKRGRVIIYHQPPGWLFAEEKRGFVVVIMSHTCSELPAVILVMSHCFLCHTIIRV